MRRPKISPVLASTIVLSAVLLGKPGTPAAGLTQTNKYYGSQCQVLDSLSTTVFDVKPVTSGLQIARKSTQDPVGTWGVFCPVTVSTTTQTPFTVQNLAFSAVVVTRSGGSAVNLDGRCHGLVETPQGEKVVTNGVGPDANKYSVDRAYFYCDIPNATDVFVESFVISMSYVQS